MRESESNNQNDDDGIDLELVKEQRDQYFQRLRTWLDNARLWQNVSAGFPYYYAGAVSANSPQQQEEQQQQNHNTYVSLVQAHLLHQNIVENIMRQGQNTETTTTNEGNGTNVPFYQTYPFTLPTNPNQPPTTYEFVIPPLWKRLVAEFMDFMILFTVKLALTFLLMESFNFINIDFYGFDSFQKNLENPEVAFPMAFELLTLELLHRLVVCAYETYFLRGQLCATPGKRYMGLMVVKVETLTFVPGRRSEVVSATGAKPLGWQKALARSALKNLFVGLLLPLCVTFYIFPHNRTSYDMMANTVVVESHPEFLMYHAA